MRIPHQSIAIVLPALATALAAGQDLSPCITEWKINTTGQTGYGGIVANVTQVRYDTTYAYVRSNNIPSYSIGPWPGNPNGPTNQNWTFRISRNPTIATTPVASSLGQVGVMANGVVFYNPSDAMSWENENVWHQNAYLSAVGASMDSCGAHPGPSGAYHNHPRPVCLWPNDGPAQHSHVVGYAFDSFPVYGPYGYANADGSGGVARMRTSYRTRNMTLRTTLANGTQLPANLYGPPVSATYPLGYFIEDYEYVAGLGDLDEYNGRTCVTPEYPQGFYCYFTTISSSGASEYPYFFGPKYRGVVTTGNTGMGGHNTIPTGALTFCCTPCEADISGDRAVDGTDLSAMLAGWGGGGGGADLDRNGVVDGTDLSLLLAAWGTCP